MANGFEEHVDRRLDALERQNRRLRWALAGVAAVLLVHLALRVPLSDKTAAKKEVWRQALDGEDFMFPEAECGVRAALAVYGGDCDVHLVRPADGARRQLAIKFVRGETEVLALDGHLWSGFRESRGVLYFADYSPFASGCRVCAYDLRTGQEVWATPLEGLGPVSHSAYQNRVALVLTSLPGLDGDREGAVRVSGQESGGEYVEVLDRRTGAVLAHKVYPERKARPK